jgi:co-chaperonin GroES (HSP10)
MMKLVAEGDKIILKREEVFHKNYAALKALGIELPGRDDKGEKDKSAISVFGRIVSIGPEYKGNSLSLGQLVVFGTGARVLFRDGSEFIITRPEGILAHVEDDDAVTPTTLGRPRLPATGADSASPDGDAS